MAPLNLENSVILPHERALGWQPFSPVSACLPYSLSQLHSLLLYVIAEHRGWKERAAGAWASWILIDQMPSNGDQEKCSSNLFWLAPTFFSARKVHHHVAG